MDRFELVGGDDLGRPVAQSGLRPRSLLWQRVPFVPGATTCSAARRTAAWTRLDGHRNSRAPFQPRSRGPPTLASARSIARPARPRPTKLRGGSARGGIGGHCRRRGDQRGGSARSTTDVGRNMLRSLISGPSPYICSRLGAGRTWRISPASTIPVVTGREMSRYGRRCPRVKTAGHIRDPNGPRTGEGGHLVATCPSKPGRPGDGARPPPPLPAAPIGGPHTANRLMAASSSTMPRPGTAGTRSTPSGPGRIGSASMKSRRSAVQPGGS